MDDVDFKKGILNKYSEIVSSSNVDRVNPTQAAMANNDMKRGLSEREKIIKNVK